jgi:uncharacterized membrane protein
LPPRARCRSAPRPSCPRCRTRGSVFGFLFDQLFWPTPIVGSALAGIALIVAPLLWLARRGPERELVRTRRRDGHLEAEAWTLSPDEIARVERAVGDAELLTSCELRVHLEHGGGGDATVRAREVFRTLAMRATALRNAVLVYCAQTDAAVVILADDAIAELVPARELDHVCASVHDAIVSGGDAPAAIAAGLVQLGETLRAYFPRKDDDVDELPNEVSFGP